jgi:hypothetical protein
MSIPVQVTQWVDENYKKPRIDPVYQVCPSTVLGLTFSLVLGVAT